jgi:ribosomal protein S18 acetylase RimI-like enzyme
VLDWSGYLRLFGLPPDLLRGADLSPFSLVVARLGGEDVAAALAFDHDGDCGIYNVGTVEWARRRGLGTALTALQLHHARERGCRTASLQATPMAERVYAAAGFRDLGRFLEYVP